MNFFPLFLGVILAWIRIHWPDLIRIRNTGSQRGFGGWGGKLLPHTPGCQIWRQIAFLCYGTETYSHIYFIRWRSPSFFTSSLFDQWLGSAAGQWNPGAVALTTSQLSGQFSSHRSPSLVKIYCVTRIRYPHRGGQNVMNQDPNNPNPIGIKALKDVGLFYIAGKFAVLQLNVIYFYLLLCQKNKTL
jgi:hypothetical protein